MSEQRDIVIEQNVTIADDNTVLVKGIGKASDVGELDVKKFIEVAMNLKSFWR
ncbi:hypothetical protein [Rossellomorea aquimaris]|uniref:hypothetical protein n=1 Tax=Rossellomorea aquimaris TaxID=189382 RepID=UPI000A4AE68B|nr:hypothetical protein [Rossellomorea aquimaris]